jgi:hypothetical protein
MMPNLLSRMNEGYISTILSIRNFSGKRPVYINGAIPSEDSGSITSNLLKAAVNPA